MGVIEFSNTYKIYSMIKIFKFKFILKIKSFVAFKKFLFNTIFSNLVKIQCKIIKVINIIFFEVIEDRSIK